MGEILPRECRAMREQCTCTCTSSIDASRFALQRSLLVLAFSLHVTLHYACNSISRAFNCTPQAAIFNRL